MILAGPLVASAILGGTWPGLVATTVVVGIGSLILAQHGIPAIWPLLAIVGLGSTGLAELDRRRRARTLQAVGRDTAAKAADREHVDRLIENLPVAIAMLDLDLRYLVVSQRWVEEYGLSGVPLVGRRHYDVFPEISEPWKSIHQRALAGELVRSESERFERTDGTCQWLRWEVRPWRNVQDKISGILIFSEDITARKQQEEARDRLATIVASCEDAIVAKTLNGIITSWNRGAESLFGYTEEEALGKPMLLLFPESLRDEEAAILERIRRGERVEHFETERIHRDGRSVAVSVTISPVCDSNGLIIGASSIARDITAKHRVLQMIRENEERLEAVTENLAEGLLMCDLRGTPLHWNRAAVEMHRIEDPGDAHTVFSNLATHFEWRTANGDVIRPEDTPLARILRGEQVCALELPMRSRSAGWERTFAYNGRVVQNAGDQPVAFLSITDISARTAAEATRARQQHRTALLAEISRRLVLTRSSREMIEGIFTQLADALEVDVFLNYMANALGDHLALEVSRGLKERDRLDFATLRFGEAVCGRVAEGRAPIILSWPQLSTQPEAIRLRDVGIRAYAGFPLQAADRLIGTISFGTFRFDAFDPEDLQVMKAVSDQVAAALDRDRLVAEISSSNARFKTLVDQAADALMVYDHQGQMIDCNHRACEYLGYTRAELLELNLAAFVVDFELTRARATWAEIQQQGLRSITTQHRRKDGSIFPVEARIGSIAFDQRSLILAQVRDISERNQAEAAVRESEERFRQVVENIEEVFWMTDVGQSRLLYISPGYQRIWGRPPEELYQSLESWIETIHPEDRERVRRQSRELQSLGEYDVVYRIVRPDKSVRWIQDKAYPVNDASGNCTRIVGVATDITEQRQLEAQVRQSQKMDAIGTLAGGIAHDFNNILGAILGFTELARFRLGDESLVRNELDGVLEGARRASGLVGQILAFSRRQDPRRVPVQISQVVAESLRLLRATIPAGIEFDIQLPLSLPPILADPDQIHQVIMNLGTNAYQAIGNRSGRITIRADEIQVGSFGPLAPSVLRPGAYVHLSFTDTGCGIPQAVIDRIFEPFFTTKAPGEGTGLGLSVVHGILKAHEGAITVYSQPDRGTTLHLYFPCAAAGTSIHRAPDSPTPRGNGERILVLDDERPLAQLGMQLLESLGYQAMAVTEPAAALAEIEANPTSFRLLITDLSMPGMNGLDLARRIHTVLPRLPILLTSGFLGGIHLRDLDQTGIRRTLGKPFSIAALAQAVKECLADPVL